MTSSLRAAAVALTTLTVLGLSACAMPTENVRDESGAISEANDDADVFDLRVGDCLNEEGEDLSSEEVEEVSAVPTVPCSEEHDYEVYSAMEIDGSDYPGQDAVNDMADEHCTAEFGGFVGTSYEESALDYSYFTPTEESWSFGDDREILCMVYHPEKMLTGTAKDSKG